MKNIKWLDLNSPIPSTEDIKHNQSEIVQELHRILGRRMLMAASTTFISYWMQVLILKDIVPNRILYTWACLLMFIDIVHGMLGFFIQKKNTSHFVRRRLLHAARFCLFCLGSVWGTVVLLPGMASAPYTLLFIAIWLGASNYIAVHIISNDSLCLGAFTFGMSWPLMYGYLALNQIPFELFVGAISLWVTCQLYGASMRKLMTDLLISNFVNKKITIQLKENNATLKSLAEKLKEAATTDSLTGCLNRRGILAEIEKELARAKRAANNFCLLIFDLDYFKSVNDKYGHNVGDTVLKATVFQLKTNLRPTDSLGRWGGEEFVCVLANIDIEQGVMRAEEMRRLIEQTPIETEFGSLLITASVGIACYSGSESLDELIDTADKKLYLAKGSGRNKVCC